MPTRITYGMLSFHRGCAPLLFLHGGVAVNPRRFKEPRRVEKPIEKSVGNPTSYSAWDDTWIAVVHAELMSQYANFQYTYQSLFNPVQTKGALENHSYPTESSNNSFMELGSTKEKQTGLKTAVGDCCGGDVGDCCIGNHGVTNGAGVTGVSTDARGASMTATDTKGAHMEVDDEFDKGIDPDHHMSIKSGDATGLDPDHHKVDMSNNAGGEDEFDRGIDRLSISTSVAVNQAQHMGVNQGVNQNDNQKIKFQDRYMKKVERFSRTLGEMKKRCDQITQDDFKARGLDSSGQSCLSASENVVFDVTMDRVLSVVAFLRSKSQQHPFPHSIIRAGLVVLIRARLDGFVILREMLEGRIKSAIKSARLNTIEKDYEAAITVTREKLSAKEKKRLAKIDQYEKETEKLRTKIANAQERAEKNMKAQQAAIEGKDKFTLEKYEKRLTNYAGNLDIDYIENAVQVLRDNVGVSGLIHGFRDPGEVPEDLGSFLYLQTLDDIRKAVEANVNAGNVAPANKLSDDEKVAAWKVRRELPGQKEKKQFRAIKETLQGYVDHLRTEDEDSLRTFESNMKAVELNFEKEKGDLKKKLVSERTAVEKDIGVHLPNKSNHQNIDGVAELLLKEEAFADLEQQEIIAKDMSWKEWYKEYTKDLKKVTQKTEELRIFQTYCGGLAAVCCLIGFGANLCVAATAKRKVEEASTKAGDNFKDEEESHDKGRDEECTCSKFYENLKHMPAYPSCCPDDDHPWRLWTCAATTFCNSVCVGTMGLLAESHPKTVSYSKRKVEEYDKSCVAFCSALVLLVYGSSAVPLALGCICKCWNKYKLKGLSRTAYHINCCTCFATPVVAAVFATWMSKKLVFSKNDKKDDKEEVDLEEGHAR